MVDTLEEVICEVLKSFNVNFSSLFEVKKCTVLILNQLVQGNYKLLVPEEDGAREYISTLSADMIQNEIRGKVRDADSLSDAIEKYAEYIFNYIGIHNITSENVHNIDLTHLIEERVDDINLRNHLKEELTRGNVEALKGYIGDKFINKYNMNLNSGNSYKK